LAAIGIPRSRRNIRRDIAMGCATTFKPPGNGETVVALHNIERKTLENFN
jgi:hypothetical protein